MASVNFANVNVNVNLKKQPSSRLRQPNPFVRLTKDLYYGRKDISQLVEKTLFELFPKRHDHQTSPFTPLDPNRPGHSSSLSSTTTMTTTIIGSSSSSNGGFAWSEKCNTSVSQWIAWILYRTKLPDFIAHFALYLLYRLSNTYTFTMSNTDDFLHRRLIFTAIILASKYALDTSYNNNSWAEASRYVFSPREISLMELEVLSWLNWQIGEPDLIINISSWIQSLRLKQDEPESPVEKAITNTTSKLRDLQSQYRYRNSRLSHFTDRTMSRRERLRARLRHSTSSETSESSSSSVDEENATDSPYNSRRMECSAITEGRGRKTSLTRDAMMPNILAYVSTQIVLSTSGVTSRSPSPAPAFDLMVDKIPC